MFEDDEDDDDFTMSEAEMWFEDNMGYFYREEGQFPQYSLEIELFYHSVYLPFKTDLKKPVREMVFRHYPHIGSETRPEVLERVEYHINRVGHEFLLFLYRGLHVQKLGKDLRKEYPDLDKWAVTYPAYRKPNYIDPSFWDKHDWLSDEDKKELIAQSRKEAEEHFEFREKPRFEFCALLQDIIFKYYREIMDMDTDGWTLYQVFLQGEYTNFRLDFEHYESFIDYGFEVEDLKLPYREYHEKLTQRCKERLDERIRRQEEEGNV